MLSPEKKGEHLMLLQCISVIHLNQPASVQKHGGRRRRNVITDQLHANVDFTVTVLLQSM